MLLRSPTGQQFQLGTGIPRPGCSKTGTGFSLGQRWGGVVLIGGQNCIDVAELLSNGSGFAVADSGVPLPMGGNEENTSR